jgi:glutathionyl-hydroquinone reductase
MVDVVMDRELQGGDFKRQESRFHDWIGVNPRTGRDEPNPKRIVPVGPGYDWCEPHGGASTASATLAHVVATGARVEFTTGK